MGLNAPPVDFDRLRTLANHFHRLAHNPMPGSLVWREQVEETAENIKLVVSAGRRGWRLAGLVRWMERNRALLSVEQGEDPKFTAISLSVPYTHPTDKSLSGFIYQDTSVLTEQLRDQRIPRLIPDVIANLIEAVEQERNQHDASKGDQANPQPSAAQDPAQGQ